MALVLLGMAGMAAAPALDPDDLKKREAAVKDLLAVRKVFEATQEKIARDNQKLKKEIDELEAKVRKLTPPADTQYQVTDPRFGELLSARSACESARKQYDRILNDDPDLKRLSRELQAAQDAVDRVDRNLLGRPPRPTLARNIGEVLGTSVPDGQCVAFVRMVTGLPPASTWRQGVPVKGANIPRGTAIATFNAEGRYGNLKTGNHAAIYDGQDAQGIWVYDQWTNEKETKPVHRHHIPFQGGKGSPSRDAAAFSVIETEQPLP
jgi:hypothetical protein